MASLGSGFTKNLAPTELIFAGTGPRRFEVPFITDMRTSGGVIDNPSSLDLNDGKYKLTSFTTEDGMPRAFSCAVKVERSGGGVRIRGMRIVIDNPAPSELHGIRGYSNPDASSLGADWDIGLWNESGQGLIAEDVHVVGYWRMYGCLQTAVIDNVALTSGDGKTGSEFCRYLYCNFQGAVGFGVRGGDVYQITEVGDDFIGIENAPNLPFRTLTRGTVSVGLGSLELDYRAVAEIGGTLRLIVQKSPSGVKVGDQLRVNVFGFGISNTVLQDCEISGLSHASGRRATQLDPPFDKPSAALEVSGTFIRGLTLRGTKLLGHEDVLWHFHDAADITLDGQTVVEPKVDSLTRTIGGRCIASSAPASNARTANPAGFTRGLRMDFITSLTNPNADLRPQTNLPAPTRFASSRDNGFFQPQSLRWLDQVLRLDRLNVVIQGRPGGAVVLRDAKGATRLAISEDGDMMTLRGGTAAVSLSQETLRPSSDGETGLGGAAFRWQHLFIADGAISTSTNGRNSKFSPLKIVFWMHGPTLNLFSLKAEMQ